MCLELYKVIQGKPIEAFRNTFANLALPLFSMAEPIPPKVMPQASISSVEAPALLCLPSGRAGWQENPRS